MVRIRFQSIRIDGISESSGFFQGENRLVGRRDTAKSNEGLGEVIGNGNTVTGGTHVVRDDDTLDMIQPKLGR